MSKFLVMYHSPMSFEEQMANATPEQMQEGMAPWMAWFGKMGSALVDYGVPLGKGATLTKDGQGPKTSQAAGYSIIEAGDLQAATAAVADHPHFLQPDNTIEVIEMMPMPGM